MATLDELVVLIKADSKKFESSLSDIQGKLGKLESGTNKQLSGLSKGFAGVTATVTALGAALGGLSIGAGLKSVIDAGSSLEKSRLGLAGLINATTQFSDAQGKALNPVDNLNASVGQATKLYDELRKQALLLADIETPELLNNAVIALPQLSVIGVTEAAQQAELIGTITASIKQLGIATSEIEAKKELQAFLSGDVTGAGVEFAKLVAQVNGGTEAFKANYAQALQNGQAYQFLTNSLLAFRASGELSASTLSNQFSVLNDSVNLLTSTIGTNLLPSVKGVIGAGIDSFFTKGKDGALEFNKELQGTAKEIGTNLANAIKALEPLVKPTFDLIIAGTRLVSAAFGDLGQNADSEFSGIGQVIQLTANLTDALATRVGGAVKLIVGAYRFLSQAAITSFQAAGLAVVSSSEKFLIAVQNLLNGAIGLYNNFAKSVNGIIGKDLVKSVGKIDFGKALNNRSGTKAFATGVLNSTEAAFKGSKIFDEGFNQLFKGQIPSSKLPSNFFDATTQGFNPTSKAVLGGAGTSKKSSAGGKGKGGTGAGGANNDLAQKQKELEAQRQKNEGLRLELGFKQQLAALEANTLAKTQPLNVLQKENETKLQLLDYETKIAEAKFKNGQITEQELVAIQSKNALKAQELSNENALLPLQLQKIQNEETLAAANLKRNEAIAEATLNLQNGKITQEEFNTKVIEAQTAYDGVKNKVSSVATEINNAITAQTSLNAKANELTNLTLPSLVNAQKENTTACGKTTEAMQGLQQAATQVGQSLSNSIGKAIETGKFDLKEFASSILQTFLGIGQNLLTSFLGGGAGGGGGGGLASLFGGGFASGGLAPGGKVSLVGERGPELIYPNRSSRVISNKNSQRMLSGGGQGNVISINVTSMDGEDALRVLSQPKVQSFLSGNAARSVQKRSNRVFNRSTMEFQR